MKENTRSNPVVLTLTRDQATFALDVFLSLTASHCSADPGEGAAAVARVWQRERPRFLEMMRNPPDGLPEMDDANLEDADMGVELGALVEDAMKDKLVALPVKMTRAQYARLVGAAKLVDASVEDVALANVMHGLDHSASSLSDSLACIRSDVVTYAHERKAFAEPGSRHPLQSVDAEMEIGGRRA